MEPADASADRAFLADDGAVLLELHALAGTSISGSCPDGLHQDAEALGTPEELLIVAGGLSDDSLRNAITAEIRALVDVITSCGSGELGEEPPKQMANVRAAVEQRLADVGVV